MCRFFRSQSDFDRTTNWPVYILSRHFSVSTIIQEPFVKLIRHSWPKHGRMSNKHVAFYLQLSLCRYDLTMSITLLTSLSVPMYLLVFSHPIIPATWTAKTRTYILHQSCIHFKNHAQRSTFLRKEQEGYWLNICTTQKAVLFNSQSHTRFISSRSMWFRSSHTLQKRPPT